MSRHSDINTYAQAGDWLMGTARRNPEALLLLAAGCCLLMRSGGKSPSRAPSYARADEHDPGYQSDFRRTSSNVRQGVSRAADSATDYASQVKERVSETASSYAESVSEFAESARRNVVEQSEHWRRQAQSTMQAGMDRVLRDQPLAIAVMGLAAGAAVAAAFPSTEIESRTLGGAREALTDAASKAGERVMGAASKAGERLRTAAQEQGLSAEGLKGLASEVAETFTSEVAGKSDDHRSATTVPDSQATGARPGQGFGAGPAKKDADWRSDVALNVPPGTLGNR
jgi:hypothetical protein